MFGFEAKLIVSGPDELIYSKFAPLKTACSCLNYLFFFTFVLNNWQQQNKKPVKHKERSGAALRLTDLFIHLGVY